MLTLSMSLSISLSLPFSLYLSLSLTLSLSLSLSPAYAHIRPCQVSVAISMFRQDMPGHEQPGKGPRNSLSTFEAKQLERYRAEHPEAEVYDLSQGAKRRRMVMMGKPLFTVTTKNQSYYSVSAERCLSLPEVCTSMGYPHKARNNCKHVQQDNKLKSFPTVSQSMRHIRRGSRYHCHYPSRALAHPCSSLSPTTHHVSPQPRSRQNWRKRWEWLSSCCPRWTP